jgi:alanine-glyoxylate transaminase/serine-glyoxylate transaminase/serine-pyruvate transaminase
LGYWQKKEGRRAYHHTAPISSCYALHEGIRLLLEEGLEKVQERHKNAAAVLKEGLESRGFVYAVKDAQVLYLYEISLIFV